MELTERKTATVLAALRFWQEMIGTYGMPPISDYFEECEPLTVTEIDMLCTELNFDEKGESHESHSDVLTGR